jgi:glyoxylase-like metal-dependent hydrolase (beta-lactamase superfamily II)
MKSNRRKFLQSVGAGAAGLTLASPLVFSSCTTPGTKVDSQVAVSQVKRNKQMWPIKSQLKSKRIKFDVPQNQISWAFMKELREHNKTRKIYDINPYVEVYQFRDNLYGLFTENCDGMGDVWMYLTVGPEKALLIDTAYGLGDLKGLVDEITGGKPVIVVNTHDHYDHAYGNCRFDKVYCHEYLVPYLETQNEHMWDYLFDDFGNNIWLEFDRNDLPTFKKYEIEGVKDGHTFNLGGDYEFELVFTGGHAAGHAAYLDKKGRNLFTGDNICSDVSGCGSINVSASSNPHAENTALKVYRDNVERLVERMGEYDFIFPQHFMNNIDNCLMLNILTACDEVLANPEGYDYKIEKWGKDRTAKPSTRYYKFIKDFSVLAYR